MADRTVTVRMRMDVGSAIASARAFGAAISDTAKKATTGAATMSAAIDNASGKQKRAYDNISRTSTVVAVGLVGAFGLAAKASMDFDKAMSSVAANSGAHGAALQQMRQAAIAAGRDTAFSATEAAQGEDELAKAGLSVADVVHGGLKGALNLAAAGQISVADAAETAATAMTQFKLSGAQVPHVADLLSAAANKAQGSVGDMGMALKQSGLVAAQFGLSIEDTVGTLASFASAGLIGSDAGTSFKTMLLSLANPSQAAASTMRELGIQAYDAQGKFVGITALAGQLHDKMSGLTQAQRDQALATMFGSDAIRAANILYQQGAGGISGWIAKVNDSGNASRTAAEKMNNLSGDLEQLKGSLETALIQSGSQANGALRGLVQTVTAAVNAFSALPGPVQGGIVALAGVSGAGILAAKGILSIVGTVRDAKEAWSGFRAALASGEGATGKMGAAVKGAAGAIVGPLGIALAGSAALLGVWIARQEAAKARLASLTDAVQKDAGAIGSNTRAWMVHELQTRKIGDLNENLLEGARGVGINLSQLTDAMLGQGDAAAQVKAQLQGQIDAETKLWHSGKIGTEQYKTRTQVQEALLKALNGENSDLKKASAAAKDNAAAMAQGTTAQQQAASAAVQHASDEKQLVNVMQDATRTADDLKAALDALAKGNMDADQAAIDQAKAIQAATKAIDKRRAVSLGEKQALLDVAAADQKQLVAMKANNATGDELVKKLGQQRAGFISLAEKMGYTRKEAEKLADRYGLIPAKVETKFTADDRDFLVKLHNAQGLRLDPKTGLLRGNNSDYFNKWLQAKGLRIDPKTGLFRGNNADYYNKWLAANHLKIDTKTGRITGNTSAFWAAVNSIPATVATRKIGLYYVPLNSANEPGTTHHAQGGIDRYADGGMRRRDLNPFIAERPTVLFGETETGGEAYIPLGSSKRQRSVMLLTDVARMFGLMVVKPGTAMADGGILQRFADGGTTGDVSLSDILSRWTDAVKPASKSDVNSAIKSRKTQLDQLRNAEDALARARRRHDPRAVAAAERKVRKEREDLADATKKLHDVENRYKYAKQSPATQLGSALGLGIKDTGAFIKNLTTLSDRGFGALANALLQMGGPQAEKIAADAVKFSNKKLSGLQGQLAQAAAQQAQLANMPAILNTRSAIKAGKGASWVGLLEATGLAPDVLAVAVKSMLSDLNRTAQGRALIADMHAHGYAQGGEITGRPGVDTNLIRATAGEFMTNQRSTAKYRPWLEAINNDTFGQFIRHLVSGGSGGRAAPPAAPAPAAGPTIPITINAQHMEPHELAHTVAREAAWQLR